MSKLVRSVLSWLGLLGAAICGLSVVAVWFAVVRIDRATERMYERVDHAFEVAGTRLADLQQTVAGATITAEGMRESLRGAAAERVRENVDSLLQPEEHIERLEGNLMQAGLLLDASSEVVLHIQESLDLVASLGMPVSVEALAPVLERVDQLNREVAAASEMVASIGERLSSGEVNSAAASRGEQALALAVRLLATLGEVDRLIAAVQRRLSETQERVAVFEQSVRTRVHIAAAVVSCLIVWMGAGQVALWRVLRRSAAERD
ncbi:MAG: hypothetical protein RJP95_04365 [Pirellulales bacterium]